MPESKLRVENQLTSDSGTSTAPADQKSNENHLSRVDRGATPDRLAGVQDRHGTQNKDDSGTSTAPADQRGLENQWHTVGRGTHTRQTIQRPKPMVVSSVPKGHSVKLDMSMIGFYADALNDLEAARIANGNRLGALTRSTEDSDGEIRGYGLTEDHDSVRVMGAVVEGLTATEIRLTRALEKVMKAHPLGPWMAAQHGIGFKQGARLLAAVNDPYWHTLYDRPRQVAELWAYCGYHVLDSGTAPKRAKGQKANWSQDARKRCWLIAQSIIKAGGPYREIYDATKLNYEGAVHSTACVRCGPAGHPAQTGSALSKAHIHARALRAVSKEVLRQLWIEARRLHGDIDA